MKFKVYTRRFVDDLIAIADEPFPTGFQLTDPVYPAFDLGGYVSDMVSEDDAKMWVSQSDERWNDWDEVRGARMTMAVSDVGGREKIERLLQNMIDERIARIDPDDLIGQKEFAEIVGWDRRKVATYYGRGALPKPVKVLASGPVWIREQAENYKKEIDAK